jgi:hypothetical protein
MHRWLDSRKAKIDFWGRVVDSRTNPIVGAQVLARISWVAVKNDAYADQYDTRHLTTDTNGEFRMRDATGSSLTIEQITASEYVLAADNVTQFYYGENPSQLDPNQPVIFKMVYQTDVAQVRHRHVSRQPVPFDGTLVHFDLFNGARIATNGQLQIAAVRKPLARVDAKEPFDWLVVLTVNGGGIMLAQPEGPNEAPSTGYLTTLDVQMKADDPNWSPLLEKEFFVQLEGGKYFGRLKVDFNMSSLTRRGLLTLDSWINSSGSRTIPMKAAF